MQNDIAVKVQERNRVVASMSRGTFVHRGTSQKMKNRLYSKKRIQMTLRAILLALSAGLTACNFAGAVSSSAFPQNAPLVTLDPLAPETPTPFLPDPPTATPPPLPTATTTPTPLPTSIYAWGNFAAPVESSAIEIPPPMPQIDMPENVVNFILLGSDERPYEGGHRTDTMSILSLDPNNGRATLISIPRDLYVYIPGWRVDRINTADVRGGPDWVAQTILYNFGIEIHYWVRINFSGFTTAIDLLGGIDVESTGYLYDRCGNRQYSFGPGVHHMDGYTALCYVRMRYASSDFDRLRRQQEVIQAIFRKVLSLNGLSRVPELYSQFNSLMETNIGLDNILPLIPLATSLASDSSRLHHFTIDPSMASSWRVPYSGASVLLPNREAILAMLETAFGP
jgi:LCP family protein required for cell wall assembly